MHPFDAIKNFLSLDFKINSYIFSYFITNENNIWYLLQF